MYEERVVSGMRPTGAMHLGHFHGALKNWVKLQSEYPCLYFAADWHALTTHYETPEVIEESVWDMVIDWLAAGIDPAQATLFIQSRIPEHAELHTLLSMITPLSWLERVPSYKDQQEKLVDRDLSTYGFLGYPLLQAADVLVYRAKYVPVGEDQVPHVEMMREVARRFNHVYGREHGFEDKAKAAAKKLGGRKAKVLMELRTKYQEQGHAMNKSSRWATAGFRSAGMRSYEYKRTVSDVVYPAQGPMRERAHKYLHDPTLIRDIVADGCEKARKLARETMREVREAMGL